MKIHHYLVIAFIIVLGLALSSAYIYSKPISKGSPRAKE